MANLSDIFDKNRYNLDDASSKSRQWFNQQVLLLSKQRITPNKVIKNAPSDEIVKNILPGNLYMYAYDPKTKETLPYYDRFPLVFPFSPTEDGFIGLNMHYLPYQLRIKLLDSLMIFASNTRMDKTTKLKYSWAAIDGVSRFSLAKPCVKRYIYSHIKSQIRKVNPEDWATAMLLPVEKFNGASIMEVWNDSRKLARRV